MMLGEIAIWCVLCFLAAGGVFIALFDVPPVRRWMRRSYRTRRTPRWEVKPDDDAVMHRVRWSEPDADGRYLWVAHYPDNHRATRHAEHLNASGKRPWEYPAYREGTQK